MKRNIVHRDLSFKITATGDQHLKTSRSDLLSDYGVSILHNHTKNFKLSYPMV